MHKPGRKLQQLQFPPSCVQLRDAGQCDAAFMFPQVPYLATLHTSCLAQVWCMIIATVKWISTCRLQSQLANCVPIACAMY